MKDESLRKAIAEMADDLEFDDMIILDDHAYDKSIVGVTEDGRLVYDYSSMVEEYMEDEACDDVDAEEWLTYNTLRAIPYMGDHAPIVVNLNREDILDRYGDAQAKGELS